MYNLFLSVQWARSTTANFTSGILHTWNWLHSRFNMSWNGLFKNSFPLSVCTQTGRLRKGLMYLGSLGTDWNADATDGTVFDFRGTTCNYFEKTSITLNKYLIPPLYLLSPCTSTKSHSQTSIIFTLQGLRGNLFRTGNVKCTHSLLQARLSVPLPSFRF
jgi:hypothetical protein